MSTVSTQWQSQLTAGGSAIAVQPSAAAPSPPNVFAVAIGAANSRAQIEALRQYMTLTGVHCELDFRHSTGVGETQFVQLVVRGTNGDLGIELRSQGDGKSFYFLVSSPVDAGTTTTASSPFQLPDATWVHLALDIGAPGGVNGSPSAKVDGTQRLDGASVFPDFNVITAPKKTLLDVGAWAIASTVTWSAQFDNVECIVTP